MKAKLTICFIGCLCMFATTGCWDRNEVKDLAVVMATGVDKTEQGIRVSMQVAIPSGVGGGQSGPSGGESGPGKSFFVKSATGQNANDADQKLQETLPRKIFLAHRRVIVIGEDLAKDGIDTIIDAFSRDAENRLRNLVLVAKGGQALQVLKTPTFLETVPAENIRKLELHRVVSQ